MTAKAATKEAQAALVPLYDRVLVKLLDQPDGRMVGRIFLPAMVDEQMTQAVPAEVVAVGQGRQLLQGGTDSMMLRAGMKVLVPKRVGSPVKLDGQDMLILQEAQVLGVLPS